MPLSRLEVLSARDDQTITRYKWIVHGTSNATDALSILDGGLTYVEGRPIFSTNLVSAYDWAANPARHRQTLGIGSVGEPGSVIICAVPERSYLGQGIFTSAYVDRAARQVTGAPLRYASARKELALYSLRDTEAARVRVEAEVANGFPLAQQPRHLIQREDIMGSFASDPAVAALMKQLNVAVLGLQSIDFASFAGALMNVFRPATRFGLDNAERVLGQLLEGTAESIMMSRLRMMRWQGLALLGYRFSEGQQLVEIGVRGGIRDHLARIDEFGRGLASSTLFSGELGWLKLYASRKLELMKIEAEGLGDEVAAG
jgi:hypothetical protein